MVPRCMFRLPESAKKHPTSLEQVTAKVVMVLAVSLSLYQLYTAGITALTALVQRSIHLGAILSPDLSAQARFKKASQRSV